MCIKSRHQEKREPVTPPDLHACLDYVRAHRSQHRAPFDVVASGEAPDDRRQAADLMHQFAEAGATWWVEEGLGWDLEEFRQRVRNGPPRA